MIKTIILLVIVFYTFPCQKINAQSRDTSNIFAGYYIAVYNKSDLSHKKIRRLQEIKSLPYYNTASNKAYLFKCLYVKGTFLQLRIDTIDKNWQDYLLDIYSISTKKKKKLLLVTSIDSLHSGNAPDWEL